MRRFGIKSVGLRGLMLGLVLAAVLATLVNCLVVAYNVQRDALIRSSLEANRAYAFKTASSINEFVNSVQERLAFSSALLGADFANPALREEEALRLQAQDSELNAVLITDASGRVLQTHPVMPEIQGKALHSEELTQALRERRPLVSHAYRGETGNLLTFVSRPIFSPAGEFLGIVGGSVYLEQPGVMHALIGEHQLDGTFAFVADENYRLLYHPDHARIGEVVRSSPTVDAALRGEAGVMEANNYLGIPMLAGYAPVPGAQWAVVTQQPRDEALAPLNALMHDMLVGIVPAGLVGLVLILLGATLISRPLRQLSAEATHLAEPEAAGRIQAVRAWYTEAAAIRQAMIAGVQLLQKKITRLSRAADTDPLTGLANRRAMGAALAQWDEADQSYAVLALDIDHFKRVNDTYGHDAGDVALQHVATLIADCARNHDIPCRAGGEEFCLLLPGTAADAARRVAERIRARIADTPIEGIGHVTISIGVAWRGTETPRSPAVLKRADERLYDAKRLGRNRVEG